MPDRVEDLGFRVQGSGFRVQGSGFRVVKDVRAYRHGSAALHHPLETLQELRGGGGGDKNLAHKPSKTISAPYAPSAPESKTIKSPKSPYSPENS